MKLFLSLVFLSSICLGHEPPLHPRGYVLKEDPLAETVKTQQELIERLLMQLEEQRNEKAENLNEETKRKEASK